MVRLKNSVLLGFALELGSILADAPENDQTLLRELGINLGIGFQLKDDLLDVYADSSKFGKQIGGDIISNKKTYLLIKALELSKGEEKKRLNFWLKKKEFDSEEKVREVVRIYNKLDIKALTEKKMNEYFDKGLKILDSLAVSEEKKEPLKQLTLQLIDREM